MEALPDPLLGRIFAAAGREAGAAITLVCRRWQQVFYSEPDLWRSLELTAESLYDASADGKAGQWFAAKASLLRRIGGLVQQLSFSQEPIPDEDDEYTPVEQLAADSGSEWQLVSSVLAHLSPATLQSLRLDWVHVDAAAAAALQRFTSLTQLRIDRCGDLPSRMLEGLPSLQHLMCLHLWCNIPAGLSTALQHLTQLTSLTCDSRSALPGLSAVFPLTRLRRLVWQEAGQAGMVQVDLQQLLARLPQLERWGIFVGVYEQPGLQVGGAVLSGCVVEGCNRANGMAQELRLWRIERMPSLQQLVAAALPAGMQPSQLRSLDFVHCVLSLPAVLSCPFVGHLTSLSLSHCSAQDGNETQVYEALLQQAPRLLSLSLSGFWPSPIPAAIVSRTGLSRLCLASDGMAELPPGPYLSTLRSLDLTDNGWDRLPAALAATTSLTELSLVGARHLVLTAADVDGVLCRLLHLRRLYLDVDKTPPHVLDMLLSALPHLVIS